MSGVGQGRVQTSARFPRTRGECVGGPRPCPWARCRHTLLVDVHPITGQVIERNASESCSLDVADRGGVEPAELAALAGVSPREVNRIEHVAQNRIDRLVQIRLRAAAQEYAALTELDAELAIAQRAATADCADFAERAKELRDENAWSARRARAEKLRGKR